MHKNCIITKIYHFVLTGAANYAPLCKNVQLALHNLHEACVFNFLCATLYVIEKRRFCQVFRRLLFC